MAKASLGIQRLGSLEISVQEAAPWLAYLTRGFGFQHVASSGGASMEQTGTRRHIVACGPLRLHLLEAVHAGSPVRRFLEKHPEGISRVNFRVKDVRRTEELLLERHATPTNFIQTETLATGPWRLLTIATPLGDVEFGFVDSADEADLSYPGLESVAGFDATGNPLGLVGFDHLTANVHTLMPVIAFYEHVLGFSRCWDVHFHPEDLRPGFGSGLKSIAMTDEAAGLKLVTNEPLRPRYHESQVQLHLDTNRGPGIQHVALAVNDAARAVECAMQAGVLFIPTPPAYYAALPQRLRSQGVPAVAPSLSDVQRLNLLVDGDKAGYLLQGFCQDQSVQFQRPHAGPLFIELIQRCGCQKFGEGNFRALFEAMQPG